LWLSSNDIFWTQQTLKRELKKCKDLERRSEIEELVSWIVSTCHFKVCLLCPEVWHLLVLLITFTSLFRINIWSLIQQEILRQRYWLGTRRNKEKQQRRECVLFISRNVTFLFLPHHFISLFSHFPYVRNEISAYANFVSLF